MHDVLDDDHPLRSEYYHGAMDVVQRWVPPMPRDGWKLAGKNDSEDGPIAYYIRKIEPIELPVGVHPAGGMPFGGQSL